MERYEIYSIINTANGKIYVGQTKQGYLKRFAQHLCPADGSPRLRNAVKKHGKKVFVCELLDIALDRHTANEKEKMWIKLLGTYANKNGYNLSMGGSIGEFNEETLKKMSDSHKGEKNHFYGKHHTEETKAYLSKIKKGRFTGKDHHRARKVLCVESGEVFDTVKEAEEKNGIAHGKISAVCNKEYGRRTAGGYHWQWVTNK